MSDPWPDVSDPRSELHSRTRFEPAEVEPRITERWLASGLFHPQPIGTPEENFSIAIPPPNVTGSLHMGHALNGSVQDALVRYHRMTGQHTKWVLGTDHAGIATQSQVEKALAAEGIRKEDIGREAFIARVWEWREHYGGRIIEQLKRLGASVDYEDERFTLDDAYVKAVLRVFVSLYEKGYIYRDRYMVNWDPGLGSAISDLEVEERRETDTLYWIRYDVEGGGEVVIATVRPETMLGDTAVAVHPEDERYRALVGRTAILPLIGRRLPIIADEYVKPDFATGQLKITPAHDPNDFEIGERHGLEKVSVIGEDGRMTAEASERFTGLTVMEARQQVVQALEAEQRITKRESYEHEVPYSHRSGERIEPLISLQWFMRMDELAQPAIAAVLDGRVRIIPDGQRRRYLEWMGNIRPWVISRQLWWGHRLPVHYCERHDDHITVVEQRPDKCPQCGAPVHQDEDVLDTWFSSALWPFATLGWPEQTPELQAFYPTDVLSTAREIIFLWVARMVMMGLEFTRQVPFSEVYVHSVILARDGRRMSKSLGNGIDPLDEIERHGADAVRFGMLAMSSTQDVKYSDEKVQQGQALANKLFNAARFVLLTVEPDTAPAPEPRTTDDRWILSRLQRIAEQTAQRIKQYDFSHAALGLYEFVYGELCDWYLELVKHRLRPEADADDRKALSATLKHVLKQTLAIAHPVIPFVTEELWAYAAPQAGLLAGASYPTADPALIDAQAEEAVTRLIAAVQALRGWRDTVELAARVIVPARLEASGYDGLADSVGRLSRFDFRAAAAQDDPEPVASIPVPGGHVAVLEVQVDQQAAQRRRVAQRAKLEAEISRSEAKLANQGFVAKAPPQVVEAQRARLAELRAELDAL